ncbi:protein kinase domain-containing protein [Paramicrobacterium agarici]|uniref:non-specific serine/threonine protein kinase n=1 Tax=Paramicrobacterium agarici TaxID=630514 RepID=A0A2A9DZY6_9MICO|nr:protein kinase [Microbacterium agarici]PFG32164.1 serine/threonine protein kinase [Microbacterium agarici]TQO22057.1 serine/threonine protein kinase [Microbacterium agarici]
MARQAAQPPRIPGLEAERLLGSGGFSDVFLYRQELPRRQVAVKVLSLDEVTDASRAAFVAEANLMAQVSAHPYIVTIYNAAVAEDGRPYFVMEYCPGPSLSQQYRYRQFTVADVLRTGIRVTSAVATAHSSGILHRDIKPANVLTNAYGWPALADFGISSAVDADHAQPGESQSLGMSIPWSPPEMFADHPVADVRSDVFALAATVYTLLAGRSPFEVPGQPNGSIDLIGRIERGTITPLERTDVPPSLMAVLRRGMATRREDRFPSAVDFGRSLQRVELELAYSTTPLDVPNLASAKPQSDATGDDATRIRPVTTVTPQHPAPSEPADDDATVARPVQQVNGQPPSDDETRMRALAVTPQVPVPPATDATAKRGPVAPTHETPDAASQTDAVAKPRRRLVPIVIGAAALLLVGGGVTASFLFGGQAAPEKMETSTGEPLVVTGVPAPVERGITVSEDGSSITFEWGNPAPEEGDVFIWRRLENGEPGPKHVVAEPSVTIDGVSDGDKVCVTVVISRSSGKTSTEPLEMCTT